MTTRRLNEVVRQPRLPQRSQLFVQPANADLCSLVCVDVALTVEPRQERQRLTPLGILPEPGVPLLIGGAVRVLTDCNLGLCERLCEAHRHQRRIAQKHNQAPLPRLDLL